MIHEHLVRIVLLLFLCAIIMVPADGSSVSNSVSKEWAGNLIVDLSGWVKGTDAFHDCSMSAHTWQRGNMYEFPLIAKFYDNNNKLVNQTEFWPIDHEGKSTVTISTTESCSYTERAWAKPIYNVWFDRHMGIVWVDIELCADTSGFFRKSQHHVHIARYNATQLVDGVITLGTAMTGSKKHGHTTIVTWTKTGAGDSMETRIEGDKEGGTKMNDNKTNIIQKK